MSALWRAFSLTVVAAALLASAWALIHGVRSSRLDPANSTSQTAASGALDIQVTGFGDPEDMRITVLSSPDSPVTTVDKRAIAAGVVSGADSPQLLALHRPSGELIGLAWLTPDDVRIALRPANEGDARISLSPQSTALALVALAPAVLDPVASETSRRVAEVEGTVEFESLVAEVAQIANLQSANDALERALATVLDRVSGSPLVSDPACDIAEGLPSVATAGVCVAAQLGTSNIDVLNGQDRWVAIYPQGSTQACALLAPRPATLELRPPADCPLQVELGAPGPTVDGAGPIVEQQVALPSLLGAFQNYASPFAELAFGARPVAGDAVSIAIDVEVANQHFASIVETNSAARAAAMTLADPDQTAPLRTAALLSLGRTSLANATLPTAVFGSDFSPNADGAALLALFDRVASYRVGNSGPPASDFPGWTAVNLGPLIEQAP